MLCPRIAECRICGRSNSGRNPQRARRNCRQTRPGRRQVSRVLPARILLELKNTRRFSLQLRPMFPAAQRRKTASGELTEDDAAVAAAVVMDAAKDGAMDAVKGAIVLRRVFRLQSLPRSLPWLFRVIRNRDGRSSLDRRRDTSRSFFLENRFPNTGDWRSLPCLAEVLSMQRTKEVLVQLRPLRPSQSQPLLWLRLSLRMNPSLPVRAQVRVQAQVRIWLQLPTRRASTNQRALKKITAMQPRLPRPRLRSTGTANFIGGIRQALARPMRSVKRLKLLRLRPSKSNLSRKTTRW